jgi:hypothetical protein
MKVPALCLLPRNQQSVRHLPGSSTGCRNGWQTYPSKKVRDSLKGITDGIGECIIMPAGDVFTFAGLDSDDAGAVYAQCNYANASGHEITK